MAIKIYKYPIEIKDTQNILMPFDANVISVQVQNGVICLWAEAEHETKAGRTFYVVGTGHERPEDAMYIGTVQMPPFVWHIYEEEPA